MDLNLTDEQREVVSAVRSFLADRCPADVVRASEPHGFDADLWVAFCELAAPTIGVPEELGGGGASLLDLELVCEQVGSFLAPVPFIEGAVTCRALASSGDPGSRCLDGLVAEPATVATIALRPAIAGTAVLVPYGPGARAVVGMDAGDLVLVARDGDGVVRANLGSSSLADRSLRGPGRSVLATGEIARATYGLALDEWRTLMSGALVGLGEAALTIGVEYAKNRVQFGAPIGSFQSIARDLADAATLVDGARLLAREAAWARTEDEGQFAPLASMALLFATRAARRASNVALHVHGGYGFTLEYDIQLYYRRAEAWPLRLGDPRRGAGELADALFGPVEAV
ncbi:MAG: acyl-CoA dehydrogenase [Acidimicrobiales bacterium]|jgi:alkylation response protein AidB-like acyl-CoA dehydrogenase